jgi:hypothetical protein
MNFMRKQYRDRGYQEVYTSWLFTQLADYKHFWSIPLFLFLICLSYRCWAQIFTICNFGKLPDMLQTTRRTCLFLRYAHSQNMLQNLCQFILHYMCCSLVDSSVSYNLCWLLVGSILVQIEKQEFGLKPMNCPGHCLMFANRVRSYRGFFLIIVF